MGQPTHMPGLPAHPLAERGKVGVRADRSVASLRPGLSGGVGVPGLDLNEHLAPGQLAGCGGASSCSHGPSHPPGSILPLMAQNPSQAGPRIWGFFRLKERSGPSKGSPPKTAGLGASCRGWESGSHLVGVGTRLLGRVFPPLSLPHLPPPNTCFQSPLRPLSPSPSPFPFPLRGPHSHVELIRRPSELVTQLWPGLEEGALSTAPMLRGPASPSGPCLALCSLELETTGAGHGQELAGAGWGKLARHPAHLCLVPV